MRSTATRLHTRLSRLGTTHFHLPPINGIRAGPRDPENPTLPNQRQLYQRIGRCLAFGCDVESTNYAARLLKTITADWRNIQAIIQGFYDPVNVVYTGRLRDGEHTRRPWHSITRESNLAYIAEKSTMRFLDFIVETAAPEDKRRWEVLRDHPSKDEQLAVIDISNELTPLRPRSFPFLSLMPQTVSAYSRLYANDYRNTNHFKIKTVIFSHTHLVRIADINVMLKHYTRVFTPSPEFPSPWLGRELERMVKLISNEAERSAALKEGYRIMGAVDKLEKATWKDPNAAEDFGSAAP
ncbi:hypothetical protein CORC01_07550 [Colletotrichum orchidophilum]|uniref:Uncharacterized protein n=1 Tax=Colletotrichum orchidophilum TaxID=1209926 RepID=A0A1G4B6P1_9PEZI|nr:uncharacterized protein CORC01_07550 [Colletotrichum orchidophilum]OHE97109.1 hypothetical protein CORC01_07550 [Colletotrichum orchidophilum]